MASILLNNLTIDFPIYSSLSIKNKIISVATGGTIGKNLGGTLSVKALDNISFKITHGDRVALIGHNGSGKTTMLRAIAGVYYPTAGSIYVDGSISTLLNLQEGLDLEANGWDNIIYRALAIGMSLKEVRQNINNIAKFTELGDFLDMPVRTYSSGMMLRLAFSISIWANREIVLMDEWLSVGDKSFSQKSEEKLQSLLGQASILVMATQSEDLANRVCNRVIRMEHGRVVSDLKLV